MKILMDKILRECVEQEYEEARLGRIGDFQDRDSIFAEILGEFEANGAAMRYLDAKGRIAWKATPKLRGYLDDLRLDAEAEFDEEGV